MALGKLLKEVMHLQKNDDTLVTAQITEFLRKNPEGLLMKPDGSGLSEESKKIVVQVMDAAFGGNSDRSGRFGASSRGTCLRSQMWTFLGMPRRTVIDTELSNLFNDGKYRHLRWQIMLLQSGAVTDAEYQISLPRMRLKSSVDAINLDEDFIVEIKGDRWANRMLDKEGGVDEKHALQIETMFLATGMEKCAYIVEDKQSQNWREVVVVSDKLRQKKVREELKVLNGHVDARTLPEPLEECKAKDGAYKTCPFARPCIERWKRGQHYFPDKPGDWGI